MAVQESGKFKVPPGFYRAKFSGVQQRDHPEYGPGLEWRFEIVDGAERGKITSRTTAPEPTSKNSAGKILAGILGSVPAPGAEIELGPYLGRTYKVVVELNTGGSGNTRVAAVLADDGAAPAPSAAAAASTPPPPSRPRPAPTVTTAAPPFDPLKADPLWVETVEGGVRLLSRQQVQDLLDGFASDDEANAGVGVMDHDKRCGGWKQPKDFGMGRLPF